MRVLSAAPTLNESALTVDFVTDAVMLFPLVESGLPVSLTVTEAPPENFPLANPAPMLRPMMRVPE